MWDDMLMLSQQCNGVNLCTRADRGVDPAVIACARAWALTKHLCIRIVWLIGVLVRAHMRSRVCVYVN